MLEVYAGFRSGRPTAAIILSGVILVGSLGLAWTQVRGTRALGDPVHILGTPLIIRPPRGWVQERGHPGVFVFRVRLDGWGREALVGERTLQFRYRRWPEYQSPLDLLELSDYREAKASYALERARIGSFEGLQVRRQRVIVWRGRQERGESIYRLVSTAGAEEISVEYTPLGEVSAGEEELFDVVCNAVVLEVSGSDRSPSQVRSAPGSSLQPAQGPVPPMPKIGS